MKSLTTFCTAVLCCLSTFCIAQNVSINTITPILCNNDSTAVLAAQGNGPGLYQWYTQGNLLQQDSVGLLSGLASGIYTVAFTDSNALVSFDSIALQNPNILTSYDSLSACDSVFFQNKWVTLSGDYVDTFQSVNNCDSVVFTNIEINDLKNPTASCQDLTVYLDSSGNGSISIYGYELANSSNEFSGVQGQNGWEYGVYPAFNAAAFSLLSNYTGFIWNNPGVGAILDLPQIDSFGGHPQFEGLRWAVRRWNADYNGLIRISGDFYDRNLGGGDGANVRIFKNGVQLYEYLNIPGNAIPYSINVSVLAGDVIDFIIDPKFDASFDDTHFTASIWAAGLDNGSTDNCAIDSIAASQLNFSCADAGVNAVVLTVTDNYGNSDTCMAMVTVIGASGVRNDTLSACDSVFFDNSWYYSSTLLTDTVPVAGSCDSLVNTYIIIADSIVPSAICQNISVQLDSNGQAVLNAIALDGGSSDNCSQLSFNASTSLFDCSQLGANNVTLFVSDNSNNTNSCIAVVTVVDSMAPVAVCQNLSLQLDNNGLAVLNLNAFELANAANDFSGTQGQNGWEYGVYSAFNSNLFAQLPNFSGFVWNNPGSTLDFPQLDPNGGHPQFEGLRWAVRRWTSSYNGPVTISGEFFDRDLGGGDGAHVRIFKNGQQVYEYLDIPGTAVPYFISMHLSPGDQLDFIIDPKFDAANDDTHFTASISARGVDDGSFDNCAIATYSLSDSLFDCNDLGSNSSVLTLTDSSGNSSSCVATVVVEKYQLHRLDSLESCGSYTWIDGNTYTDNNDTAVFVYSGTCTDTIVRLDLVINNADTAVVQNGFSLSAVANNASYQWYDCTNMSILPGDSNQVFNAVANGSYALIVEQNGCIDTSACFPIVGLNQSVLLADEHLKVYPNPFGQQLSIEFDGTEKNIQLHLYTPDGRLVASKSLRQQTSFNWELSGLPNGLYWLEIDLENRIERRKLVKQQP